MTKNGVAMLVDILDGSKMRQCDINTGLIFAIGKDVRRQGFGSFKTRDE